MPSAVQPEADIAVAPAVALPSEAAKASRRDNGVENGMVARSNICLSALPNNRYRLYFEISPHAISDIGYAGCRCAADRPG